MNEASITCNKCASLFLPIDCKLEHVKDGDLTVSFFRCPNCGEPYLVLAADQKMRSLIDQRSAVREKIKAGREKKFRESTLKKYMREDEKLKQQQDAIFPELQKRGEETLRRLKSNT